ncbi:hypothetical protein GYA54_04035 [Candidatus Kuenenbacteria bacterium]|nr:hypothetical protein [Candidatus Kuenenbacteria bacterium]
MKKNISLSSVIIFIGGFLFLSSWPSATSLHALLFFCTIFFYFWVDYRGNLLFKKQLALFIVIFVVVGTAFITEINNRSQGAPVFVHDNILQVEPAIQMLLQGKNPYIENYFGTELEDFPFVNDHLLVNPALYHCIKLPFHLVFSTPFYLFFNNTIHFFDERLVYIILFIMSSLVLYQLPKKVENKFSLVAAYAFNPLFLRFFFGGERRCFCFKLVDFNHFFT